MEVVREVIWFGSGLTLAVWLLGHGLAAGRYWSGVLAARKVRLDADMLAVVATLNQLKEEHHGEYAVVHLIYELLGEMRQEVREIRQAVAHRVSGDERDRR